MPECHSATADALTAPAGIQLNTSTMDILLYLCSGGRFWDAQVAGAAPASASASAPAAADGGNGSAPAQESAPPAEIPGSGSSVEAGAEAVSSNGQGGDASPGAQEGTPAEPGAGNGAASTSGRVRAGSAQNPDVSVSLSPEVSHATPILLLLSVQVDASVHQRSDVRRLLAALSTFICRVRAACCSACRSGQA